MGILLPLIPHWLSFIDLLNWFGLFFLNQMAIRGSLQVWWPCWWRGGFNGGRELLSDGSVSDRGDYIVRT